MHSVIFLTTPPPLLRLLLRIRQWRVTTAGALIREYCTPPAPSFSQTKIVLGPFFQRWVQKPAKHRRWMFLRWIVKSWKPLTILELISHGYTFCHEILLFKASSFSLGLPITWCLPWKKPFSNPLPPLVSKIARRSSAKLPYKDHSFLLGCSRRLNVLSREKMFPNKRKWKNYQ